MREGGWGRWAGLVLGVLFVAFFTFLNGRERISLNLGVAVLYQVPLVVLVLLSFLLGMVTMFLLGLRHDLRVRRYLREQRREPIYLPRHPEPPPPGPIP